MIYAILIALCWAVFICYWIVSATRVKRNLSGIRQWAGIRIIFIFTILLIILFHGGSWLAGVRDGLVGGPISPPLGVALCAGGIAFAIWARYYLGKNWGMPMSVKEKPELVTGGPYAYVRHPIYTGVLFGMLGSALASGTVWFIPVVFGSVYFIYSALQEEKQMTKEFPIEYPEYKKRSKMLIPFIF